MTGPETERRRTRERDRKRVRVTFGMIVLNGRPFITYNLRALYPFAEQIVVVEGAAEAARAVASPTGHSLDGTLEALHRFKKEEDPEGKITVVTAEDEGHRDGFWPEKDEMSRAYAARAVGNYLWQVDCDEFYRPTDMEAVIALLAAEPSIAAVSFPMRTVWGGLDYRVTSYILEKFVVHRVFKWEAGYRYVTHRPPTVVNRQARDLRTLECVSAWEMKRRGIYMLHYELLFPKQVADKCQYYASWNRSDDWRHATSWMDECYTALRRPFRVHMEYDHLSWLRRFEGEHPPQVLRMMEAVTSGDCGNVAVRRTDDIEALVSSLAYRVKCSLLEILVPADRALAAVKGAARRALGGSPLWRLLQASRERLRGQIIVRRYAGKR